MAEVLKSLSELPTLYSGEPPVRSLKQKLPFPELTWQNFERLCSGLPENIPASKAAIDFTAVRETNNNGRDQGFNIVK